MGSNIVGLDTIQEHQKLVFVLEQANLEVFKTIKGYYELLNSDDHNTYLKKRKRTVEEARPDIVHYCLLTLLDSPLNKSGHLKIYVRTHKGVLIDISPHVRIPRTLKRFSGLMVQLLHKLVIRAADGPVKLLSVIKNPLQIHLPVNCIHIGLSHKAEKLVDIDSYVIDQFGPEGTFFEKPVVVHVGAMAHGQIKTDELEETLSISGYPLSGAVCCGRVCGAFEKLWKIH